LFKPCGRGREKKDENVVRVNGSRKTDLPMERTHIIIKGNVHQKSIEQAGKGKDTAMETAMQGKTRQPRDMTEGTRKAMKTGSFRQEIIVE
jgi:hypothetical protein